jgi:hypothetical protein
MENIIDLIATDASPSDISVEIKSALFAKASDRIDALRPEVANAFFDSTEETTEDSEEETE